MRNLDFDPGRAADAVRNRDAEKMAARYRRVFGGDDGRTVLLDLMVLAKVAQERPIEMTERAGAYHDGRASLALEILTLAGPDPVGAALGVMTTELEGTDDDRSTEPASGPAGTAGSAPGEPSATSGDPEF